MIPRGQDSSAVIGEKDNSHQCSYRPDEDYSPPTTAG